MRIVKERCERKAYPNRVYPDRNRIRLRVNGPYALLSIDRAENNQMISLRK